MKNNSDNSSNSEQPAGVSHVQRISGFFREAAKGYVFPVKLSDKWRLPCPDLKALSNGVLTVYALSLATSFTFPTAKDYLLEKGVNPVKTEELTGGTVARIREKDSWGTIHSYMDFPSLPLLVYQLHNNPVLASRAYTMQSPIDRFVLNRCSITLADRDLKTIILNSTGIPEFMQEDIPVTVGEIRNFSLFHEMRHCHRDNSGSQYRRELDADLKALDAMEAEFPGTRIRDYVIASRALNFMDFDHDSSLYLDAQRKGETLPDQESIKQANEEFVLLLGPYFKASPELKGIKNTTDTGIAFIFYVDAFSRALESPDTEMSPLARRRAELFIESARFFAPGAVKSIIENRKTQTAPKAKAPALIM